MADLVTWLELDAAQCLNLFRDAFYGQYGETIRIGSDEFAASSVFAYGLATIAQSFNAAASQRFIETATGTNLNVLAANWGVTRPLGQKATCTVNLVFTAPGTVPARQIRLTTANGTPIFTNPYQIEHGTDSENVIFECIDRGSFANGLPRGSLDRELVQNPYVRMVFQATMTSGGTDAMTDDDEFRAYLKAAIASYAGAGTYLAYEGRAKLADARVIDAHVVRQDEDGYVKGKVKLYVLVDRDKTPSPEEVRTRVETYVTQPDFKPIGDYVEVRSAASEEYDAGSGTVRLVYPRRFESYAAEHARNAWLAYNAYLAGGFNRPVVYADFCQYFRRADDRGVYASDAMALGVASLGDLPAYPPSGAYYQVNRPNFEIIYDDTEA